LSFPTPALPGSGLVVGINPSQPLLRLPHEYFVVKIVYHYKKHLSNPQVDTIVSIYYMLIEIVNSTPKIIDTELTIANSMVEVNCSNSYDGYGGAS